MWPNKQLVFDWCLILIMCPTTTSIIYTKPSILTRCYMAVSTELDPDKTYAGYVFTASSSTDDTELQLNAKGHGDFIPVLAESVTEIYIDKASIQPGQPHMTSSFGFTLISLESMAIFYRDSVSFYQLRETQLLPSVYTIITYHRPTTSMLSVVTIAGMFEATKVTMTFKDGVNVNDVLGDLAENLTITDQEVTHKFGNRAVVKLQTTADLTGTVISGTKAISVVAGSVSLDEANPFSYVDHLPGNENTGTEYVVFGFPEGTGSCVCRMLSLTANVEVTINDTDTATLSAKGDFYDVQLPEGTFVYITASGEVSVALLFEGNLSSDMVVALPIGFQNTTRYTFTVPELTDDINMDTYLVVTLPQNDTSNVKMNGEKLPANVTWFPVPGTDYVGAYIPVSALVATQSITSGPGEFFNAYLIGIGDNTTFGSAVIQYEASNYDNLQFSSNRTVCGQPEDAEERATVTIKKGKRKINYELKHTRTAHVQACQMICLLYNDCIGVNFKSESTHPEDNCDILMPGALNTINFAAWTYYKVAR